MPEIDKCRQCAGCCINCVFLDFDKDVKLFKCLIYKNKNRMPVHLPIDFSNQFDIEGFFNCIELIVEGDSEVCHHYKCSDALNDFRDLTHYYRRKTSEYKKAKLNIINFSELIDILNQECVISPIHELNSFQREELDSLRDYSDASIQRNNIKRHEKILKSLWIQSTQSFWTMKWYSHLTLPSYYDIRKDKTKQRNILNEQLVKENAKSI